LSNLACQIDETLYSSGHYQQGEKAVKNKSKTENNVNENKHFALR
jgi:hypothetical protein